MSSRADEIEDHIANSTPFMRGKPEEITEEEFAALHGENDDGPAEPALPSEIPEHLLDVPGAVGHITRWITKSARYPQPLLSLGAALALVGTAAGRKFAGPTDSGTHLYILALAPTGTGKNHPAKQAKRLMKAAAQDDLIGPGQFMSEPAVYQYVAAQPLMLCYMDELGSYLQRINNPKGASGYEKAISGALRTFWGASFDVIHPPAWAKSSSRDVLKPIQSPALSIYGMSVHEEFYSALQSADIANGFLNRFLILSTHQKPEEVDPSLPDTDVPDVLVRMLQDIGATPYDTSRARPTITDTWKPEHKVTWASPDVRDVYHTFRRGIGARSHEDAKLLSRVPEMAVRLATIRAIGRSVDTRRVDRALQINEDDITWACELAQWSGERMLADSAAYMSESEFQARTLEVLRIIRSAPRQTIKHTDLSRKVKARYKARELREVIEALQDSDMIEVTRVRVEGAKKPTDFIRYVGG